MSNSVCALPDTILSTTMAILLAVTLVTPAAVKSATDGADPSPLTETIPEAVPEARLRVLESPAESDQSPVPSVAATLNVAPSARLIVRPPASAVIAKPELASRPAVSSAAMPLQPPSVVMVALSVSVPYGPVSVRFTVSLFSTVDASTSVTVLGATVANCAISKIAKMRDPTAALTASVGSISAAISE